MPTKKKQAASGSSLLQRLTGGEPSNAGAGYLGGSRTYRALSRNLVWIVFVGSLTLTGWAWRAMRESVDGSVRSLVSSHAGQTGRILPLHSQAYSELATAGQEFLQNPNDLDEAAWRASVSSLGIGQKFPGVEALAFVSPELDAPDPAQADAAEPGQPARSVTPHLVRAVAPAAHHVLLPGADLALLEGFMETKAKASAKDSAHILMTGAVAEDHGFPHAILLFPVRPSKATEPVAWVVALLRTDTLFKHLTHIRPPETEVEVFAGETASPEHLVYSSSQVNPFDDPGADSSMTHQLPIELWGRPWTLVFHPHPSLMEGQQRYAPTFVLFGGITGSLLLLLVTRSLSTARGRAILLARIMTDRLRESENRVRSIIENATVGILTIDEKSTIETANPAACSIFREMSRDLIGKSLREFLQTQGNLPLERAPLKQETTAVCRDGTPVRLEISIAPLPLIHKSRFTVIVSDITERKRSEERLTKQARELERSNQELERFAYVASHDLQEPLRKIQAFGGRLMKHCERQLDTQSIDYLGRMQSAAARMQVLITDLLTLSRVTSRAQPFVKLDTNQLVEEVLGDLEVRIKDAGASVEVGPLPALIADPTQMRQLTQNLISNALKFHKKDVPCVVKVYAEGLSAGQPANGQFNVVVEDNGIGFEQQYAERIFQIFQRLHGRSEYEGTGVGLAVCLKIVERHGGTIRAYGEPGQGARFVATFPAEVAADSEPAQPKQEWDYDSDGTSVPTAAKVDA